VRTRTNDAGNLSIDFLAGFTIFMIAFIYVATLIPGLFLNLQGYTIDYNAVAYRTGVILVEDPGMPYNPSWETLGDYDKGDVLRFGLALSDGTTTMPNVLSAEKINRFFCSTWIYPDDYQSRAVFGSYPYQFNISLQMAGSNVTQSVGDVLPQDTDYGYSQRVIKVKEESNATIGPGTGSWHQNYEEMQDNNVTTHLFSVFLNYTELSEDGPDFNNPAYQINPISPLGEGIMINLTNLNLINDTQFDQQYNIPPPKINLTSITVYRSRPLPSQPTVRTWANVPANPQQLELYVDGNTTPVDLTEFVKLYPSSPSVPVDVNSSVSLIINPGTLNNWASQGGGPADPSTYLNITMQFELNHGDWFLNSTQSQPYGAFDYNYNPANVTQPALQDGTMEVAVW